MKAGTLTSFPPMDKALSVVPSLSIPCLCSLLFFIAQPGHVFTLSVNSLSPSHSIATIRGSVPKVLSRDCAYKSSVGEMLWVASAGVAVVLQYQRPKTLLWRSQCYRKQCVISQFVALRVKVKKEIKRAGCDCRQPRGIIGHKGPLTSWMMRCHSKATAISSRWLPKIMSGTAEHPGYEDLSEEFLANLRVK